MSADVELEAWLSGLGYSLAPSRAAARTALTEAGLTRDGKQRMSEAKLPRAEEVLAAAFFLHCPSPECQAFARSSGRTPLPCEPRSACERCGGSDNARAVRDLVAICQKRGATRLVIVGGAPATRQALEELVGTTLQLRLIDGTRDRGVDQARADLAWADLTMLWGATELHHKVSNQYQDSAQGPLKKRFVHVPKRGIAQLLAAAIDHFKRQ